MSELDGKVMEAKLVFWSIKIYNVLLDLIVGVLFSALILEIAGLNLLYSIAPALLYAFYKLSREYRNRNLVKKLEGKYDNLDERLQTAMEYQGAKNVIVEDLLADVTRRVDGVEASTFFSSAALRTRVLSAVAFSFLLLIATVLDLHSLAADSINNLLDAGNLRNGLQNITSEAGNGFQMITGNPYEQSKYGTDKDQPKVGANPGGKNPGASEGPIPGKGSGTGTDTGKDIYGKASSANINGNNVDFQLHPEYGGDIEIRDTGGKPAQQQFNMDNAQSVEECPDCTVGPQNEEMVRKYFEKILPAT